MDVIEEDYCLRMKPASLRYGKGLREMRGVEEVHAASSSWLL